MPLILSLAAADASLDSALYGAGPDGLFRMDGDEMIAAEQPMSGLFCCTCVAGMAGPVLLVGGAPHGAALCTPGGAWQAGWMDATSAPVLHLAPAPHSEQTGVILAATDGAGILRTSNRGHTWALCNFGLHEFVVLTIAWAPPAPANTWPTFEVVFAGTDRGLYRSPAGGLGWLRVEGVDDAVQAIAVSPAFHADGTVLAGPESGGLLRSIDGGRTFARVAGFAARADALLALHDGRWLAATPDGICASEDTIAWRLVPDTPAALCLLERPDGIVAGGEFGVQRIQPAPLWPGAGDHGVPMQAGADAEREVR